MDDKKLAASFGYFDRESDSNQEETDLVTAANSIQGDNDSFDDAALAAEFGYSDGPGNMAESGYGNSSSSDEYEGSRSTDTASSSCDNEGGHSSSSSSADGHSSSSCSAGGYSSSSSSAGGYSSSSCSEDGYSSSS